MECCSEVHTPSGGALRVGVSWFATDVRFRRPACACRDSFARSSISEPSGEPEAGHQWKSPAIPGSRPSKKACTRNEGLIFPLNEGVLGFKASLLNSHPRKDKGECMTEGSERRLEVDTQVQISPGSKSSLPSGFFSSASSCACQSSSRTRCGFSRQSGTTFTNSPR
jgi:hypothetical protein